MSRLIPPLSDDQRLAVVAAARSLMTAHKGGPVPFRHQGRTMRGIDCLGCGAFVLRAVGFAPQDRTDYGRTPTPERKLAETLERHFGPPVSGPPQPADFLTMAWGLAGDAHLAIVVDHPEGLGLIHAYASAGRVIEQRLAPHHYALITGVYRL